MARFKLNIGDVFAIPLGKEEFGFGQVVSFPRTKDLFILCIFENKHTGLNDADLGQICNSNILFLGYSNDAKLYHKDWIIIGNYTKNIDCIKMPFHRLGSPPDDIYIVNYKGERLKKIDEVTFHKLRYETQIAPIRYENALKAHYKLQEWIEEDYDKLLYKHTIHSNKVAEEIL